ncbi:MAG: SET domain-containing protein [Ferruginibacter sp.]|nr:SET domain-containing protein [Chitinophagaceae bacterium]
MPQTKLLQQLRNQTYVMLKSSPVHGIGVFAIQPIPKGCRNIFSDDVNEWIKLPISEVEALPAHSRSLIETYCLFDEENYFVPESGFKIIDPVIYLNHSSQPNISSINDGEEFEALVDIAAGEELLVNYSYLVDGMESYTELQIPQ